MRIKNIFIIIICVLHVNIIHADNEEIRSTKIEGLTCSNFPFVRAEKCLIDLFGVCVSHLFDFDYFWYEADEEAWNFTGVRYRNLILDKCSDVEHSNLSKSLYEQDFYGKKDVREDLLNDKTPLVLLATPLSEQEIETAKANDVKIEYKPIGLNATIFLNHKDNPISDLTRLQIQKIYSGEYTKWKDMNGLDKYIYNMKDRDEDNTSIFKQQFMDSLEMEYNGGWYFENDPLSEHYHALFRGLYEKEDRGFIYYTQYILRTVLYNHDWARIMKVDGVMPTKESILDGTYPYCMYIYAAVNTDKEKYPMANKIYEYLTSEDGQQMLDDYGYIPLKSGQTGIIEKHSDKKVDIRYSMGKLFIGDSQMKRQVIVTDFCGKQIINKTLLPTESCINLNVDSGIYIVTVMEQDAKVAVKKIHL